MRNIMDSFTYCIPANDTIFWRSRQRERSELKGMAARDFLPNRHAPTWFAYNRQTAQQYGAYLHTVTTVRPLKLVNIMSNSFHNWLSDHVIDYYRHQDYASTYQQIMELLIPLGIINIKDQDAYFRERHGMSIYQFTPDFARYGKLMQYKNRISIMEFDMQLTNLLSRIFGQHGFHGYIASNRWPSTFHGMFDDELCLFDIGALFASQTLLYAGYSVAVQFGGANSATEERSRGRSRWHILNPDKSMKEVWNEAKIKVMRMFGYTGPIQYNDEGEVIELSTEDIRKYQDSLRSARPRADSDKATG